MCYGLAFMRPNGSPHPGDAAAPHRLLSIQVLRALAALSVVVHHAGYDADTIAQRVGRAPLGIEGVFDATFGIHLFFVISGFIMVRTARRFGEPGASWRFFGRRLLRVAPLYWLMTSLVLLGAAMAPDLLNGPIDGWTLWLGSYLFVPVARLDGAIRPVLGQGWTLDYEMFFYLIFAGAMLLPRRPGLWLLTGTLIGLTILGRVLQPMTPALFVWTDSLLLEFLLGVGIGLAQEAGLRLGALAASVLAAAGTAAAILLGARGGTVGLDPWVAAGIPAGAILAASVVGPIWRPWRGVLMLAALGDASYSLYLTHPFAIRLLRVGWGATIGGLWPLGVFAVVAVIAAVILALLVYRLVERPMTAALNRRFPLVERGRVHLSTGSTYGGH